MFIGVGNKQVFTIQRQTMSAGERITPRLQQFPRGVKDHDIVLRLVRQQNDATGRILNHFMAIVNWIFQRICFAPALIQFILHVVMTIDD
jgi:hypothetical protein